MFGRILRRRNDERGIASRLYGAIVTQARQPSFYRDFGVADTVDGRFDMIVLHAVLAFERLAEFGEDGKKLRQETFDTFTLDMDRSLREMGTGDLVVPRKMKAIASAFYGRAAAYREPLLARDAGALADVLRRNIFPDGGGQADALAAYALAAFAALRAAQAGQLLAGEVPATEAQRFAPVKGAA